MYNLVSLAFGHDKERGGAPGKGGEGFLWILASLIAFCLLSQVRQV